MMSIEEKFCQYLKEHHFESFMDLWKKQYEKLGRVGGTISVPLHSDNKEDIESLMQKNYLRQSHARITYLSLRKALSHTQFENIDLNKVLELYFNKEILTKKDRKQIKQEKEIDFIQSILDQYQNTQGSKWLLHCQETHNSIMIQILQRFHKNQSATKSSLCYVLEALNRLPLEHYRYCSLVVFASQITKNPHAFDKGSFSYSLLMNGISFLTQFVDDDPRELLRSVGLYEDTVNNFCMICHLKARNEQGIHPGWLGFYQAYEMWNMNMHNISMITSLDNSELNAIFIVENPAVFQALCQHAKEKDYQQYAFVCTNGQIRASGYALLDLIYESGCQMYYSGDYDPEGLLIVDKLKRKYKDHLSLWRYHIDDFMQSQSQNFASKKRLASLDQMKTPTLQEIGDLLEYYPIGYQENILNLYLDDLDNLDFLEND